MNFIGYTVVSIRNI